jgi:hypothetical protein
MNVDDEDAHEETWWPETQPVEWPPLTQALFVTDIEMRAEEQNERFSARVLDELTEIKRMMPALGRPKSKKQSKGAGAKTTVNERVKELHLTSPPVAEEKPLRALGKLLHCAASAIAGCEYYKTTLKPERDKVEAARKLERARGADRFRAEDRKAKRDQREHVESYDSIDDQIDATWDDRQGGRHKR